MRNPNGYGSVYKLSGKRRRPFVVRKTIGWDDNGKQLYQTIGYYESRQLAMQELAAFNTNPYTVEASTLTFKEIFDLWKVRKYEGISRSAINGYNAAFDTSKDLHEMKFVEVKTRHMQNIISTCGKGYDTLRKIRVLYNQLFKYAMENDIITKDYSEFIDIGKKSSETSRVPFNKKEIKKLFEVEPHIEFVDTILVMIYSGLRIGELLLIRTKDVDLENRTITGGIKTEAGKNRIVPINNKILPFIEKRFNKNNEYLIVNSKGTKMKYDNYYKEKFSPIMEQLGMDHKPHDARHTFATLMNNSNANPTSIKKIIGHSSYATTEKIYTHKDIDELKKAIDMI
ncbi:site-specific integrase [Clostridium botulinum]|nr:site-specific integrase [Clostridium botulinum]NFP30057.1 site-specific integrase [Clostridium botulinum]